MEGVMIALPTTPRFKERLRKDGKVSEQDDSSVSPDCAPNYISPMLLRLIASNAPWELDVFSDFLNKSKSYQTYRAKRKQALRAARDPVEALLATIREYNEISDENRPGSAPPPPKVEKPSCSRECSERFARESGTRGRNAGGKESSEKVRNGEKNKGRAGAEKPKQRSCSRDCADKYVRECGDRLESARSRPLSARDHNRLKETSLPERPKSARAVLSSETSGRRSRVKRCPRPTSARDCDWDSSVRLVTDTHRSMHRLRPASAGPERPKPLWFQQASIKALDALERNLYSKLNISTDECDKPRFNCSNRNHGVEGCYHNPNSRTSKGSESSKKVPDGRPCTAPAPVTGASRKENGACEQHGQSLKVGQKCEKSRHEDGVCQSPLPRKRKSNGLSDIQGVQHAWVDDCEVSSEMDFPITRKFVETSLEMRCSTAPSTMDGHKIRSAPPVPKKERPPLPDVQEEAELENDDFKDYVTVCNGKENDESPSTCSSDYEDVNFQVENNVSNVDAQRSTSENSFIGKLKKSSADLFRGVHESLLVSSKLAEVVDLCSKRGQELLRAREVMAIEKPPERSRLPFKLYRSRQSKAHRRALRAELKWSIFSNGGKLRALNPIYGGKNSTIRFVPGDRTSEGQSDARKQSKRPSTAPADVDKTPREVTEQEISKAPAVSRRAEGIGPWTPTPDTNETRARAFDTTSLKKALDAKAQKKRAPLEVHKNTQQLVEPVNSIPLDLNSFMANITKK